MNGTKVMNPEESALEFQNFSEGNIHSVEGTNTDEDHDSASEEISVPDFSSRSSRTTDGREDETFGGDDAERAADGSQWKKSEMGDPAHRRRPPLRADRMEKVSPEPSYERDEQERQYEDEERKEEKNVLCILLDNYSLDSAELGTELGKVIDYFESLSSCSQMRNFLLTTFGMALEDRDFAKKAGALYGTMHTKKVGDDTVRSLLLSAIQSELEENNYLTGSRPRFLNAVFVLSEMYYHIRFDDHPVTVLGGELIKYFRWLVTGDDKELEILGICLIINGEVLKKDKPATYRKLMTEVRVAWVTRNLTSLSKSWLLLIIDMDNVNFKTLPEELLLCHMTFLGDEAFKKLQRVRPYIPPSNNKVTSNNLRQGPSDLHPISKSHSPVRVASPEFRHPVQRRGASDKHISPPPRQSEQSRKSDEWQSPDQETSNIISDFSQYQYEFKPTKVFQRRPEPTNRSQWPENRGRPGRSNDRWVDSSNSGRGNFRIERRIPVWQHEHDDRCDRDYGN